MWDSNRDLKLMPSEIPGKEKTWDWKIFEEMMAKRFLNLANNKERQQQANKQNQNPWMYNKKWIELKGKPEEIHVNTHQSQIFKS